MFAMLWAAAGPASAAALDVTIKQCAQCHLGDEGRPVTPQTPALGGQPELYALYQLVYFRQGTRKEAAVNDLLRELGDDDLRVLAKYVAALPAPPELESTADPARYRRGAALARRHRCPICHDADFSGREYLPRLAGQQEPYLLQALKDYKSGARVGIQAAMAEVLSEIDAVGLEDLAHYLAHFR